MQSIQLTLKLYEYFSMFHILTKPCGSPEDHLRKFNDENFPVKYDFLLLNWNVRKWCGIFVVADKSSDWCDFMEFFYRNHCEFSTRAAFIEVVVPFDMKYFYALLIFNLKWISIFVFYVTLFSLFDGDETTIE